MDNERVKFWEELIADICATDARKKETVSVVQQNNLRGLAQEEFGQLCLPSGITGYYHEYDNEMMMDAYAPFLDIIRDIVRQEEMEYAALFAEANLCKYHYSIWESFFDTGRGQRTDIPIYCEIGYESERMIQGIIDMLTIVTRKHPVVIFINKLHYISSSSLIILEKVMKSDNGNIHVIGTYNPMSGGNSYAQARLSKLLDDCERRGNVIDDTFEECEEPMAPVSFAFTETDAEEYYVKVQNMLNFFAFEQAINYLSYIYQKIELDKVNVSLDFKIHLLRDYIIARISNGEYPSAILLCDTLGQLEAGERKREVLYISNYFSALCQMCNGNQNEARELVKKCRQYLNTNDEKEQFKLEMLCFMIEFGGFNISVVEKAIPLDEKLVENCRKYGYLNHLAHIYVFDHGNDSTLYASATGIEDRIPTVFEGIEMANDLGNYYFVMHAYQKCVMTASLSGYNSTANYFYNKMIVVAKKIGDTFSEANVYNGLGYNNSTMDNYAASHDFYNKALEIFYRQKDIDYIMETLYNMAMNAILAGDYQNAMDELMMVQDMIELLKKDGLRVCNISKIYGLIGLSAARMEKFHTVSLYLKKMERVLEYLMNKDAAVEDYCMWEDDLYFYYHNMGLLRMHEKNYSEAMNCFRRAKEYMDRSVGSLYFSLPQYLTDVTKLYDILDMPEDKKKLLDDAREYFAGRNNYYRIRMIDEIYHNGEWESFPMDMPIRGIKLEDIYELARWSAIEKEANQKELEIRFFTSFQELISHDYENVAAQAKALIQNFKNNFNIDKILYLVKGEEFVVRYSDFDMEFSQEDLKVFEEYFSDNTDGFVVSKMSNNYYDYKSIIDRFRNCKVFAVSAIPIYNNENLSSLFIAIDMVKHNWNTTVCKSVMSISDLPIYRFMFRQIVDANEKYEMNELLKKQAVTDDLTGLYNRKGYYQRVEEILADIHEPCGVDVTIAYADLDHFKYYNDTFGHHVGDVLLVRFSKILRKVCGNKGRVARFGGDEFVAIFETADREEIQGLVDEVYRQLDEEQGFIRVVKKYMGEDARIPKEHMVSCSMGMARKKGIRKYEELSELRKQADAALYEMKKAGRGFAKWYEE